MERFKKRKKSNFSLFKTLVLLFFLHFSTCFGQDFFEEFNNKIKSGTSLDAKDYLQILENLEYWANEDVEKIAKMAIKLPKAPSKYLQARYNLLLAEIFNRKKQDSLAQIHLQEAEKYFKNKNENNFRYIYIQALQYRLRGDFATARKLLAKYLPENSSITDREHTIALIEYALVSFLANEQKDALKILEIAEQKVQKTNSDLHLIRIYNLQGLIYKNTNYRVLAIESYLKAVKIIKTKNIATKSATIILMNLGNLYTQQTDTTYYQLGLKTFEDGLKLSKDLKDTVQIIHFQERLGSIYLLKKEQSKAFALFENSLHLAEASKSQHLRIFLLVTIATSHNFVGNTSEAEKLLLLAMNEAEKNQEVNLFVEASLYITELYNSQKKYEKSLFYFQKGFEVSKKQNVTFFLPDLYYQASVTYIVLGQYQKAKEMIEEMEKLDNPNMLQIYETKIRLDSTLQNFSQALYWSRKLEKLKESIHKQESMDSFNENIEKVYVEELEKEKQKRLLKEKEDKENQQRNMFFGIILGLIIVILFTIVFYEKRKHTKWKKISYQLQLQQLDLERLSEEVQDNYEKLKDRSNFDKRLLAIVSHDLRGPVGSVAMMMDLLAEEYKTDKILNDHLLVSKNTLNSSLELLENLIFWARINQFDFEVEFEKIKLRSFIDKAIDLLLLQAKQKNLEIENLIDKNMECHTEPNSLKLVIRNLVANAIKFTEKGKIMLSATKNTEECIISVSDTGKGISEENMKKVFKTSFATIGTCNEKGTGLGLLLCKEFIEKAGGKISVESKQGEGTTFTIRLPQKL